MVASLFENVASFWENSQRASQGKDESKFFHGIDLATTLQHRGMKRSGRAPHTEAQPRSQGLEEAQSSGAAHPDLGLASGFST
jgi:hypothetical protein